MSIVDIYLSSIVPVKQAQHVDRFMVAVHEVAPEVYDMLMTRVYIEVVRLEDTGLWMLPVQALPAFDEAGGFLDALRQWQAVYHLQSDPIAFYTWHMTQQWRLKPHTLGNPVSYVNAVYQDEPVRPVKLLPKIKSVDGIKTAFIERHKPHFDGDVEKYAEGLKKQARLLKAVSKLAGIVEDVGITASDMERLAAFDWEKRPARKDQPSQYRWLVGYQCQGKRLREIRAEFGVGRRGDDELYKNLVRTAEQVGLTLRRADN